MLTSSKAFQAKRYNKIAHENLHRLPKRQHNNITVGVNATDGVHVTDNEPPPHNIYLGGWVAFGVIYTSRSPALLTKLRLNLTGFFLRGTWRRGARSIAQFREMQA